MKKKYFIAFLLMITIASSFSACKKEKGCTDTTALNFNPDAFNDDGSCLYSLDIPTTYYFERYQRATAKYSIPNQSLRLVAQLKNELDKLASWNGTATDTLAIRQTLDSLTYYCAYNTNVSLYADTIFSNVKNNLVQTLTVFEGQRGNDLRQHIYLGLLNECFYQQAIFYINNIGDYGHSSFINDGDFIYTAKEHTWDIGFGLFGMAIDLPTYDIAGLADGTQISFDTNNDGTIDSLYEYNYIWTQWAAQRDAISLQNLEDDYFTNNIFQHFILGRTAIVNQQDSLVSSYSKNVLQEWERLIAANIIHYTNATLLQMSFLGSPNENIAQLNEAWTNMLVMTEMLAASPFLQVEYITENILLLIGSSPRYELPNTIEYQIYTNNLTLIKDRIQNAYNFSNFQTENW
ncbi:MAG: hypothetical protein ACPG5B_13670 [Chitinophagales bacterium]